MYSITVCDLGLLYSHQELNISNGWLIGELMQLGCGAKGVIKKTR